MRRVVRTSGFEEYGGYARAVRIGDVFAVSGTAAIDAEGKALHPGDVYAQTRDAFERSITALRELGGGLRDVVRTRIYLVPGADWRRGIDAHRELFGEVTPTNTTLYVAGFIPVGVLVEIELDAIAN
jgi:enamine deaminase RidA (YjgF/YER057c/UK114 family)